MPTPLPTTSRTRALDLHFLAARHQALEVAAFLDRVDRGGGGDDDFRLRALRAAVAILADGRPDRARRMLEAWSDPTVEPVEKAPGQGALGAWPGA
jgi:hypothetical protein